jgi:hypothetical protein
MGSMRAARSAGPSVAASAAQSRTPIVRPKISGSRTQAEQPDRTCYAERRMKKAVPSGSAAASITAKINSLGDWRGKTLAKVRALIHEADPEIVEEWKWVKPTNPGTPVWSRGGIVCTGETYKNAVKMTFAKGAALKDPSRLFNASLDGNVRRAIDIHEGDTVDESALKDLIRAAVTLNLKAKSSKRAR